MLLCAGTVISYMTLYSHQHSGLSSHYRFPCVSWGRGLDLSSSKHHARNLASGMADLGWEGRCPVNS